jgi:hypothetical protein
MRASQGIAAVDLLWVVAPVRAMEPKLVVFPGTILPWERTTLVQGQRIKRGVVPQHSSLPTVGSMPLNRRASLLEGMQTAQPQLALFIMVASSIKENYAEIRVCRQANNVLFLIKKLLAIVRHLLRVLLPPLIKDVTVLLTAITPRLLVVISTHMLTKRIVKRRKKQVVGASAKLEMLLPAAHRGVAHQ